MASNFDVILNVLGLDKISSGSKAAAADLKKMETEVDAVDRKVTGFSGAMGNFNTSVKSVGESAKATGPPLQNITQSVSKMDTTMGTTTQKTTALGAGFKNLGSQGMVTVGAFGSMTGSAISLWEAYDGLGDAQLNVDKAQNAVTTSTLKLTALENKRNLMIQQGKTDTADFALVTEKLQLQHEKLAAATGTLENAQEDLATTQANYVREIIPMLVTTGSSALTMFGAMKDNLGGLKTAFGSMIPAVKSLGSTLSLISLTNPFFIAITVGAALVGAFVTNLFGFRDAINSVGEAIGNAIPFLKPFLQALGDFGNWISSAFGGGVQEAQAFETGMSDSMEGAATAVETMKASSVKSIEDLSVYIKGQYAQLDEYKKKLVESLDPTIPIKSKTATSGKPITPSYSQIDTGGLNQENLNEKGLSGKADYYRGLIIGIKGVIDANGKLTVSEEELRAKIQAQLGVTEMADVAYVNIAKTIGTVKTSKDLDAMASKQASGAVETLATSNVKLSASNQKIVDTGVKQRENQIQLNAVYAATKLAMEQKQAATDLATATDLAHAAALYVDAKAYGINIEAVHGNVAALEAQVQIKKDQEEQDKNNLKAAEMMIAKYGIERSELIQNGKANMENLKTMQAVIDGREEYTDKTDVARLADIKFLESMGVNTEGIRNNAAELHRLVAVYTEYQAQMDAAAKVTDEFVAQVTENSDATELAKTKLNDFAKTMGFVIPAAYQTSIDNMKLYIQMMLDINGAHDTAADNILKWQTALKTSNAVTAETYLANLKLAESMGLIAPGMQPSIKALDDMVKAENDFAKNSEEAVKRWTDAWSKSIDQNKSELQKGIDNYNKIAEELFKDGKIKGLHIDQKDIDKFEDDVNDMTEKAVVYLRTDSTEFGKDFDKDKENLTKKMQEIQEQAGIAAGGIGDKFGKLWSILNNPNLDDRAVANAIALMGPAALDEAKNVVIPAFGAMSEGAQQELGKIPGIIKTTFSDKVVGNNVEGFKNQMLLQLSGLSTEGQEKMAPLMEFLKEPIPPGTGINQYVGEVISWFESLSGQEIPADIKTFISDTLAGNATNIQKTADSLTNTSTAMGAISSVAPGAASGTSSLVSAMDAGKTSADKYAASLASTQKALDAYNAATGGAFKHADSSGGILAELSSKDNTKGGGGGGTSTPAPTPTTSTPPPQTNTAPGGGSAAAPDTKAIDAALAKIQQLAQALALIGPATGVAVGAANAEWAKLNPLSTAFTTGMTTLATAMSLLGPAAKVGVDAAQAVFNTLNPNSPTFSANMIIVAAAMGLLGPAAKTAVDAANVEFELLNPAGPGFQANVAILGSVLATLAPAVAAAVTAANAELDLLGSTMMDTVLPYFTDLISAINDGPYADLQNNTAVASEAVVNIVAAEIPGIVGPFTDAVNDIQSGPLTKIQNDSAVAFKAVPNIAESEFPRIATAMQGATNDAITHLGELQNAAAAVFSSVRTDADAAVLSVAALVNTINMLQDKEITITTHYETTGTPVGAAGGFGPTIVTHPTLLMVGEAGDEYVHVTPLRQGSHANMTPNERLAAYADPGRTRIAPRLMALGTTGEIDDAPFGISAFGYQNNFANGQGGTLPLVNDSGGKFDVRLLWLGAGNNVIGSALPVEIVASRIALGGGGGVGSSSGVGSGSGGGFSGGSSQTHTNTGGNINFDNDTNTSSNVFPGGSSSGGGGTVIPGGSAGGIGISPGANPKGNITPTPNNGEDVVLQNGQRYSVYQWNDIPDTQRKQMAEGIGIKHIPSNTYLNEDYSISWKPYPSTGGGGGGTSTSPGGGTSSRPQTDADGLYGQTPHFNPNGADVGMSPAIRNKVRNKPGINARDEVELSDGTRFTVDEWNNLSDRSRKNYAEKIGFLAIPEGSYLNEDYSVSEDYYARPGSSSSGGGTSSSPGGGGGSSNNSGGGGEMGSVIGDAGTLGEGGSGYYKMNSTGYMVPGYAQSPDHGATNAAQWSHPNMDPRTWSAKPMKNDPDLWKVVDDKGVNIIAKLKSKEEADEFIQEWLWAAYGSKQDLPDGGGSGTSTSPGGGGGSSSSSGGGSGSYAGSGKDWSDIQIDGGSKWAKTDAERGNPKTDWVTTPMEDGSGRFKVVNKNNRKNIAAGFATREDAVDWVSDSQGESYKDLDTGYATGNGGGGGGGTSGPIADNTQYGSSGGDMGGSSSGGGATSSMSTGGSDFISAGSGGGSGGTSSSPGGTVGGTSTSDAATVGNGGSSPQSGYIKPGGWGGNGWFEDWFNQRMRDNNDLWKIVDGNGVNIATDFLTEDDANQFSNFYILNENYKPPGSKSTGPHPQTEKLPPGFPNKKASDTSGGSGGAGSIPDTSSGGGSNQNGSSGDNGGSTSGGGGGVSTSPGGYGGTSTSPGGAGGSVQTGGGTQFNYENNGKFYKYSNGQVNTNMSEDEILEAERMLGKKFPGHGGSTGGGAGGGGGTSTGVAAHTSNQQIQGNVGNGGPFEGEAPTSSIPFTTRGLNTPYPSTSTGGFPGGTGGSGGTASGGQSGQYIDQFGVHQGNQHVLFDGTVIQGNQVIGGRSGSVFQGGGSSLSPGGSLLSGAGGTMTSPGGAGGTSMIGSGNQVSVQSGNGKFYQSQNGVVNTNMSASEIAALNAQFPWLHLNPGGGGAGGGSGLPPIYGPALTGSTAEPTHMAWRSGWDPMNGITEFDSAKGPIDNAPFGMNPSAPGLDPTTPWSPGHGGINDLLSNILNMIGGLFGNIFGNIGGMLDGMFGGSGNRNNNSININNILDGESLATNTIKRINGRLTLFN